MSVVFNKDLVIRDVEVQDNYDALGLVADNFRRLGFVKASYKDVVIAREKVFATGLPTIDENIGVAIPHTDIEHVHTAAISFTRLKEPVDFTVMGDERSKVAVRLVFMLGSQRSARANRNAPVVDGDYPRQKSVALFGGRRKREQNLQVRAETFAEHRIKILKELFEMAACKKVGTAGKLRQKKNISSSLIK